MYHQFELSKAQTSFNNYKSTNLKSVNDIKTTNITKHSTYLYERETYNYDGYYSTFDATVYSPLSTTWRH